MRRILVAAVVFAVTTAAGCTDEPQPRFEEPAESPSATESTSSAPAEPEPWEKKSKAGAVAFARHWVDVFNGALDSGSTSDLRALSARSCVTCNRYVDRIQTVHGNGGSFITEGWQIRDARPNDIRRSRSSVALNVLISAERVREAAGERPKSYPATKVIYRADLRWSGGAWTMSELVDFE